MKMNKGDLVQVNLGFGTIEGVALKCEMKKAWGVITEILRGGERLMVHFIKDDREYLIKRFDIKVVVNKNGQILSETNIDK
tara:strand:- start:554 stop:796 length:243 start_codon:yes stop_codon:yes gene_type:complete